MEFSETCRECNWQLPKLVVKCPMCGLAIKARVRAAVIYLGLLATCCCVAAILWDFTREPADTGNDGGKAGRTGQSAIDAPAPR